MNFNNEEVLLDTPVKDTAIAAKNGVETADMEEAIFSPEYGVMEVAGDTDPDVRAQNIVSQMDNAGDEIENLFIDPSQKAVEIGLGETEEVRQAVEKYAELVARISRNYDCTKQMITSLTDSVTADETGPNIETDEVAFTEIESEIKQLASDSAELLTEEVAAPEQEASGDKNITPEEKQSGLEKYPQISKAEFNAEFSKVFVHEFMGEQLNYTKIEPSVEQLRNQDWVVFVGGFNTAKESYYKELLNLAQSGRKILFINPETVAEIEDDDEGVTSSIPLTIRSQAAALSSVMEQEGIAKADFVAHSRGGAVAATLIAKNPGIAKRVLLDSPAGITGKEGRISLLKRSFTEFGSQTTEK